MCTLQTRKILIFCRIVFGVFVLTSFLGVQNSLGQSDFLSSQYMNSQLMINPAYAGVRNALSVNVLSRQQWMGIKDAPSSYMLSVHSPINKRMASVGGSFFNYQSGPIQYNELATVYSYLIRINERMFLSLGLSVRIQHYNIGLSSLTVIENDDPSFEQNIENVIKPNFGAGAFLYTPQFYLGISMPQAVVNELIREEIVGVSFKQLRSLYFTSGYALGIGKDFYLKPSFLVRLRQQVSSNIDVNMQLQYKNAFWVGASYRINNSMAALLNVQLSESIGVCYSYDFPFNNENTLGAGSHEISFSIDSNRFLKRNRDRRFGKKKKVTKKVVEEDNGKGVQSIRHF